MEQGRLGADRAGAEEPTAGADLLLDDAATTPADDIRAEDPAAGDGPASGRSAVHDTPADDIRAEDAPGRIARLADELLPALIARLDASGLGALEVRTDAWRIRLKKPHERHRPVAPVAPAPVAAGSRGAPRAASSVPPLAGAAEPRPEAVAASPAVGYFTPREGADVGRVVHSGEILGFVDVLGIRQDVTAPADGRIVEILAQAGEAVEYGQPLVRVGPSASPPDDPGTVVALAAAPSSALNATPPATVASSAPALDLPEAL